MKQFFSKFLKALGLVLISPLLLLILLFVLCYLPILLLSCRIERRRFLRDLKRAGLRLEVLPGQPSPFGNLRCGDVLFVCDIGEISYDEDFEHCTVEFSDVWTPLEEVLCTELERYNKEAPASPCTRAVCLVRKEDYSAELLSRFERYEYILPYEKKHPADALGAFLASLA